MLMGSMSWNSYSLPILVEVIANTPSKTAFSSGNNDLEHCQLQNNVLDDESIRKRIPTVESQHSGNH